MFYPETECLHCIIEVQERVKGYTLRLGVMEMVRLHFISIRQRDLL